MTLPTPLVETDWLAAHLGESGLVVLDASLRMPGQGHAHGDYVRRHIPGAVFFDIEHVADKATSLPHMLPTPDVFEHMVGALGVGSNDRIVVYDDAGLFSSARAWWTFRTMGHERVAVLNGGLPKWIAESRTVDSHPVVRARARYDATFNPDLVRDATAVRDALASKQAVVLDARPAGRFIGRDPEPRAGLRSGHMAGAISLPHTSLIVDGALKPAPELKRLLAALGYRDGALVVASCGSGVTASVIALALAMIGEYGASVYDGSWSEWGADANDPALFPVVTEG